MLLGLADSLRPLAPELDLDDHHHKGDDHVEDDVDADEPDDGPAKVALELVVTHEVSEAE